jgi:hypothetical protein
MCVIEFRPDSFVRLVTAAALVAMALSPLPGAAGPAFRSANLNGSGSALVCFGPSLCASNLTSSHRPYSVRFGICILASVVVWRVEKRSPGVPSTGAFGVPLCCPPFDRGAVPLPYVSRRLDLHLQNIFGANGPV